MRGDGTPVDSRRDGRVASAAGRSSSEPGRPVGPTAAPPPQPKAQVAEAAGPKPAARAASRGRAQPNPKGVVGREGGTGRGGARRGERAHAGSRGPTSEGSRARAEEAASSMVGFGQQQQQQRRGRKRGDSPPQAAQEEPSAPQTKGRSGAKGGGADGRSRSGRPARSKSAAASTTSAATPTKRATAPGSPSRAPAGSPGNRDTAADAKSPSGEWPRGAAGGKSRAAELYTAAAANRAALLARTAVPAHSSPVHGHDSTDSDKRSRSLHRDSAASRIPAAAAEGSPASASVAPPGSVHGTINEFGAIQGIPGHVSATDSATAVSSPPSRAARESTIEPTAAITQTRTAIKGGNGEPSPHSTSGSTPAAAAEGTRAPSLRKTLRKSSKRPSDGCTDAGGQTGGGEGGGAQMRSAAEGPGSGSGYRPPGTAQRFQPYEAHEKRRRD